VKRQGGKEMRRIIIVLLSVYMASVSKVAAVETGEVIFHVVDLWGQPVKYRVVSFKHRRDRTEYVGKFQGLHGAGIPLYNPYNYELARDDGSPPSESLISGYIAVLEPETQVTVLGATGPSCCGDVGEIRAKGVIESLPSHSGPLWVTIQSPYSSSRRQEATVDPRGAFTLTETLYGNNTLVVCAGSDVLAAIPLIVPKGRWVDHLKVDLKSKQIELGYMKSR